MGGYGSGWQRARKMQVEECLILATARLQRDGALLPNRIVRGNMYWRNQDQEVIRVLDFESRLKEREGEFEPMEAGREWGRYFINMVSTSLPWGGLRWWFKCPMRGASGDGCWHRVGKLYLPPGSATFGCRHCHDLTYWSCQHAHHQHRSELTMMRLIEKYGPK